MWRIVLASKGLAIISVLLAFIFTYDVQQFNTAYANWSTPNSIASRLATWDSAHYLVLSTKGYEAGSFSSAFYPLWPAIILSATRFTLGDPLLVSLILSNIFSLAAFRLFYLLVQNRYGAVVARDSLVLLLAFPGALFFSFPYTESLYLLLVMSFFWGLERNRFWWVFIAGFLMPLAKAIGVFVLIPLAWHLYEQKKPWKVWLTLLAPMLGYISYFGVLWCWTGNAFDGFAAQRGYPNSPSISNVFKLSGFLQAFLNVQSLSGMMDAAIDRVFFLMVVVLLPLIYRMSRAWFFFTLLVGLVPAGTSWFMSYRRYLMICFPVFIILAQLLGDSKIRWIFWYYTGLLGVLQVWGIIQFVNFKWAG
jgi:hypothetical protein